MRGKNRDANGGLTCVGCLYCKQHLISTGVVETIVEAHAWLLDRLRCSCGIMIALGQTCAVCAFAATAFRCVCKCCNGGIPVEHRTWTGTIKNEKKYVIPRARALALALALSLSLSLSLSRSRSRSRSLALALSSMRASDA